MGTFIFIICLILFYPTIEAIFLGLVKLIGNLLLIPFQQDNSKAEPYDPNKKVMCDIYSRHSGKWVGDLEITESEYRERITDEKWTTTWIYRKKKCKEEVKNEKKKTNETD